jgi:hypothetical protein
VIHDDGVAVFQDAVRQNAVQIEGGDEWDSLTEDLAGLGEQIAFGVVLILGSHRAVQGEIDTVNIRGLPKGVEELTGESGEVGGRDRPPGGDAASAKRGDDFHTGHVGEHAERAPHLTPETAMVRQQPLTGVDREIMVPRRDRVKRTDLVDTFRYKDARHGSRSAGVEGVGNSTRVCSRRREA